MQQSTLHNEFTIYRYQGGVKLVRPDVRKDNLYNPFVGRSTGISVVDALALPLNVYFINLESKMQHINEVCAERMGLDSVSDSRGKSMLDIAPYDNASKVIQTDKEVIKTQQAKIVEDTVMFRDENCLNFLSVKAPWYNADNEMIGVFGCSISLAHDSLSESLRTISRFGLLDSTNHCQSRKIDNLLLSKREHQILALLVRGKTSSQIAVLLSISPRTVEQHLLNMKTKLNVNSKSELIEKVIDYYIS